MTDRAALAARPAPATRLVGTAEPVGELLRAPASGTPCAHWRLRIIEFVAPGMELVHEVVSPEPLDIACQPDPARPALRVRLAPESARVQAMPALFREGSPGAVAVAQQLGLAGWVRVEEVIIRAGEPLLAEGVLSDPSAALSAGPFRTIDAPLELLAATVRLENTLSLRPVILPWALGAAAALLSTLGAAAALMQWWEAQARRPNLPQFPAEIGVHKAPRPLWP